MKTNRRLLLWFILIVLLCLGGMGLLLHKEQQMYVRNRQLIAALYIGDTKTAIVLVNAGAAPNTRMAPPPPPSFELLLQRLLHNTPPPASGSLTAFMLACGRPFGLPIGRALPPATLAETSALLQAMLAHGANIQAHSLHYMTLHCAVLEGQWSTVEWLLQHGADVNAQDDVGETSLVLAVKIGDVRKVRLLLSWGANPNVLDVDGDNVLFYAVQSPTASNLVPELLAHRANPNLHDKSGESPLQWAQKAGHRDIVRLLKQIGK